MITLRDEGEPIKNGFNFYPSNSTNSLGFVFRIKEQTFWLRYSKITKKVTCSFKKLNFYTEKGETE